MQNNIISTEPRIVQSRSQIWSCSTTKLQRAFSSKTVSDVVNCNVETHTKNGAHLTGRPDYNLEEAREGTCCNDCEYRPAKQQIIIRNRPYWTQVVISIFVWSWVEMVEIPSQWHPNVQPNQFESAISRQNNGGKFFTLIDVKYTSLVIF